VTEYPSEDAQLLFEEHSISYLIELLTIGIHNVFHRSNVITVTSVKHYVIMSLGVDYVHLC